mgnify:CR=1 FL=1
MILTNMATNNIMCLHVVCSISLGPKESMLYKFGKPQQGIVGIALGTISSRFLVRNALRCKTYGVIKAGKPPPNPPSKGQKVPYWGHKKPYDKHISYRIHDQTVE